jgi:ATP-dependent protease ClpP protease subunit
VPTSRKSKQPARFEPKGFGLRLMDEIQNEGAVHQELVARIESITQRNLVAYTSFSEHPAGIIAEPDDRLIETLLQSVDLSKYPDRLDLMMNSPGGSPTAAEKIVLTCRAYASSFRVLVPQSAMSAATMVAMGADSIVMPDTAELGPIDPQMVQQLPGGQATMRPAKAFIDAYLDLVNKTQEAIKGGHPPHPYIELLRKIDPPWVQVCVKARDLAKKIAIEFLTKWMLNGKNATEIVAVVDRFLAEGEEGSHGRAIRAEKAVTLGLEKVEVIDKGGDLWQAIWELHERCQQYVRSRGFAKYLLSRSGGINVRVQQLQVN